MERGACPPGAEKQNDKLNCNKDYTRFAREIGSLRNQTKTLLSVPSLANYTHFLILIQEGLPFGASPLLKYQRISIFFILRPGVAWLIRQPRR